MNFKARMFSFVLCILSCVLMQQGVNCGLKKIPDTFYESVTRRMNFKLEQIYKGQHEDFNRFEKIVFAANRLKLSIPNHETLKDWISAVHSNESLEYWKNTDKASSIEKNVGMFLIHPRYMTFIRDFNKSNPVIINEIKYNSWLALDYDFIEKKLFWISPRLGFFTKPAAINSATLDFDRMELDSKKPNESSHREYNLTNYEHLREEEDWNPRSLVVDYVGKKLYYVDTTTRSVNLIDYNGKNKGTIFESDPLMPLEVAIDPAKGLLFVLARNLKTQKNQIYRSNMDGTNLQMIADNSGISQPLSKNKLNTLEQIGFTLDPLKEKIYFTNYAKSTIEKIDYDGKNRKISAYSAATLSISVYNDTLYWANSHTGVSKFFYCSGPNACLVLRCKLDNDGICDPRSAGIFDDQKSLPQAYRDYGTSSIKLFNLTSQTKISNPCGQNNGGCQHHCLLRYNSSKQLAYGCACNDGYKLNEDNKSCIRKKMIEAYDPMILNLKKYRGIFWTDPLVHTIIPKNLLLQMIYGSSDQVYTRSPFHVFSVSKSQQALFEGSLVPDDRFVKDSGFDEDLKSSGYFRPLKLQQNINLALCYSGDERLVKVLAYDWITKNLYFVKQTYEESLKKEGELMVLKYASPDKADPSKDIYQNQDRFKHVLSLAKIPEPIFMTVHPYRGYIFASLANGTVIRLNADGSDLTRLVDINNSTLLAIDYNEDKLYWLGQDKMVNNANLNGSDTRRLFKSEWVEPEFMYIYDRWILTKIKGEDSIYRNDKLTGDNEILKEYLNRYLYGNTIGLKVSVKDAKKFISPDDHPCIEANGGCEMLCFGLPSSDTNNNNNNSGVLKKACACGDGRNILEDGSNCSPSLAKEPEFSYKASDIFNDSTVVVDSAEDNFKKYPFNKDCLRLKHETFKNRPFKKHDTVMDNFLLRFDNFNQDEDEDEDEDEDNVFD